MLSGSINYYICMLKVMYSSLDLFWLILIIKMKIIIHTFLLPLKVLHVPKYTVYIILLLLREMLATIRWSKHYILAREVNCSHI